MTEELYEAVLELTDALREELGAGLFDFSHVDETVKLVFLEKLPDFPSERVSEEFREILRYSEYLIGWIVKPKVP